MPQAALRQAGRTTQESKSMTTHTNHPYGDARFAALGEVRAAGLFKPHGVEIGLIKGRPIYHANRAGVKITGGAGSGKTSQIALPMILGSNANFVLLDTKNAEITRVIEPHCALHAIPLYTVDPFGISDYPRLRVSLLPYLKAGSASLVPDSQRFWMALLPDSKGEHAFFEQAGRRFGDAITRHDVHVNGSTSLQSISERWSRKFGPFVKVDRMTKEVIQNEETKEPFARVQGQGCA
jgi:type IV secretion system protein VirD4